MSWPSSVRRADSVLERPRLGRGQPRLDARRRQQRGRLLEPGRRQDSRAAAGPRARRTSAVRPSAPSVFRGRELAGRQIEQRDAEPGARMHRREREQEGRLARLEIPGVGQRAGRHHADDFAPDQALRLLRILDLLDDGDAEALAHQPRDVAVGGVKRHAAHRNRAAGRVLRSRRQRQLERARGGERVLVEHLVEVPHAEEHEGVAVLALRVEVLAHGRRGAGGFTGRGRGGHRKGFATIIALQTAT